MQQSSTENDTFMYVYNVMNNLPNAKKWDKIKLECGRKCQLYQKRGRLLLPKEFAKTLTHCTSCYVPFNERTKIVRVIPEKKRRFTRRLLKKLENSEALTKYQSECLKKLDKHQGNKLIVKCGVCGNENIRNLTKPTKLKVMLDESYQSTPKLKKKKRKDKFSGLNKAAVLSVTPQSSKRSATFQRAPEEKKSKLLLKKEEKIMKRIEQNKSSNMLFKLSAAFSKANNKQSTNSLNDFLSSL